MNDNTGVAGQVVGASRRWYASLQHGAVVVGVFLLCAILLAPRWVGYLSGSAVNQMDTDFLYFDIIHKHPGDYSNILMANVVERVYASFGFLLGVSGQLGAWGVEQNAQLLIFFFTQLFLGVAAIYAVCRGLVLRKAETALVIAFVLFSYFTQFGRYIGGPGFYNKVTVSCVGISVAYVVIAFFIHGRYRLGVLLSALLIYVHPVYSAFLLVLLGLYGAKALLIERSWTWAYAQGFVFAPTLALLPFLYGIATGDSGLGGSGITPLWWDYLMAKTSNPFPMQDGLVIVIPTLLVFAFAYYLLGRVDAGDAAEPYQRARWVLGGVVAAWLIQIVFTEIVPVSLVARLSLTRTTPFGLFFVVIAYVVTVWRLRERDESGLWLLLLVVPAILGSSSQVVPGDVARRLFEDVPLVLLVLGGYWPDFAIYPDFLLLFFLLLILTVRTGLMRLPYSVPERLRALVNMVRLVSGVAMAALGTAALATVIVVGVGLLLQNWRPGLALSLAACLLLLTWLAERLLVGMTVFGRTASRLRHHSPWLAAALVAIVVLPPGVRASNVLVQRPSGDMAVEQMWAYLEQNTRKDEMVLVVPFYDTRKLPVMPLRPVFVDWSDGQYVLYDPRILDQVVERLSLIGMDVDRAIKAERCAASLQYLDPMCRRKLFESLSGDYSEVWRDNLPRMREIAPNLTYVLLRNDHVRPSDRVVYTAGGISLIRL